MRAKGIDWEQIADRLGHHLDATLAAEIGVSACAVRYARRVRGIPRMRRPTTEERFDAFTREGPGGCLIWVGALGGDGYGLFAVGHREQARAHRYAWERARGVIPADAWVLHKCDTPTCVNVDHLFLGSVRDNVADMVSKGRQAQGERVGSARLTTAQVIVVRERLGAGESAYRIARDLGVTTRTISQIRDGRTWSHVGVSP